MTSMRSRLLTWLSVGLVLATLLGGGLIYRQALADANELFDYQLRQLAAALPNQAFSPMAPGHPTVIDIDEDIVIQIWDNTGLRLYYSHGEAPLPDRATLGFSDVYANSRLWRVYSARLGSTVVQVAQPQAGRRAFAARVALRTASPLLLVLPVLGALVWFVVGAGLAPLRRVASEVGTRDVTTLHPIADTGMPSEITPLTHALNDLLGRLGQALDAQRAFVADAAHELRTPLTALKLQIQLAERAGSDDERRAAFADLNRGLARANRLVGQLLTLARHEPGAFAFDQAPLDLVALARSVVADFVLPAQAAGLTIGLTAPPVPAPVTGNADGLRIVLGNLLDNAIRHTPRAGHVEVAVAADGGDWLLTVQDNGPGIAPEAIGRVFDRFYRAPAGTAVAPGGSGLGLAIVRQVVELHHGQVSLANTDPGLRATVRLKSA